MTIGNGINLSNIASGINRLDSGRGREIGSVGAKGAPDALSGFGDLLANGVEKVSNSVGEFEKMSRDLANGERVNVHELMLKGEQADMNLRLMMSVRNKVVEAYQEIMRLQV